MASEWIDPLDLAYDLPKPSRKSSRTIGFRVEPEVYHQLQDYADTLNLSMSELCRGIMLANIPTQEDIDAHYERCGPKE